MPAYNEADVIGSVIQEVRSVCRYPVYVVDDASTDLTIEVARKAGALVIPLAVQMGAWGATQAGIRCALGDGHDIVVTMDADGQHDPQSLNVLIAPVEQGIADVCIGACIQRGTKLRRIAWRLLRAASGIKLEDLTSGFRAYNKSAMRELSSWRATFLDFQDVGVLALLLRRGARIVDTEVPMRARRNGHSRIFQTWLVVVYYMCHTLLLGLTKRSIKQFKPSPAAAKDR